MAHGFRNLPDVPKSATRPLPYVEHQDRRRSFSGYITDLRAEPVRERVDPARCRIWKYHNRDYGSLNEISCADLIKSFKSHGKQEVPVIGRRIKDVPGIDFEIISGARRHWSVSWMRAHTGPDFLLLIEIREMTDEEAFRIADLENRHRKDISDFERAAEYLQALNRYYAGNQKRMVNELGVTKSWLSRYLELAKLPPEVVLAFGSSRAIGIRNAAQLAPSLKVERARQLMIKEAVCVAEEQQAIRLAQCAYIRPAVVVRRLLLAAFPQGEPVHPKRQNYQANNGTMIVRIEKNTMQQLRVDLLRQDGVDAAEYLNCLQQLVAEHF